jgi:hypothetical protein
MAKRKDVKLHAVTLRRDSVKGDSVHAVYLSELIRILMGIKRKSTYENKSDHYWFNRHGWQRSFT